MILIWIIDYIEGHKNVELLRQILRKVQSSKFRKSWTNQLQALKLKLCFKKISQETKARDQMASLENSIKHLEKS